MKAKEVGQAGQPAEWTLQVGAARRIMSHSNSLLLAVFLSAGQLGVGFGERMDKPTNGLQADRTIAATDTAELSLTAQPAASNSAS